MRAISLAIVAGVLGLTATSDALAQATPLRIGYVDSQAILREAPGATEAQQEFDRQMDVAERIMRRRRNLLRKLAE